MDNRQIVSEIIVQILGFLAVFAILKAFAWKRLLGAIDLRRHKIKEEFDGIENQKKNMENLEKEVRQRLENIEQEARNKIQEASNVGLALARDIQERARQDSQKIIDRGKAEIEQDVEKAKITMRKEVVEISSLITEKVLKEKLDARAHEKLVDEFIKELERV